MGSIRPIESWKFYGLIAGYIVVGLWCLLFGAVTYGNLDPSSRYYNPTTTGSSASILFAILSALCAISAVNLYWRRILKSKFVLGLLVGPIVAAIVLAIISLLFPSRIIGNVWSDFFGFLLISGVPLVLLSTLSFRIVSRYGTDLVIKEERTEQATVPLYTGKKLPPALGDKYKRATYVGDVIISYSTVDKTAADTVCAMLEEQGIRCWIAPRDILPGTDFAETIIDAIDRAKIMVLILSSQANLSEHVLREAKRSMERGHPIIPFRIEDVQPSKSLGYYIGPQHWLDALTPPLEQHILKLAETVTFLLDKAEGDDNSSGFDGAASENRAG